MKRPTAGLIVVMAALGGATLVGMRAVQPAPVRAAVVDLEKVYAGLRLLADARAELDEKRQKVIAESERKQKEITDLEQELTLFQVGSPKYDETEAKLIEMSLQYDAWTKFEERRLDRDLALVFEKAYNDVKRTLAEMAAMDSYDYDLILLDDSRKELIRGTTASIQQQISARRILYRSDALDITDDVIQRMNNAYTARQ